MSAAASVASSCCVFWRIRLYLRTTPLLAHSVSSLKHVATAIRYWGKNVLRHGIARFFVSLKMLISLLMTVLNMHCMLLVQILAHYFGSLCHARKDVPGMKSTRSIPMLENCTNMETTCGDLDGRVAPRIRPAGEAATLAIRGHAPASGGRRACGTQPEQQQA